MCDSETKKIANVMISEFDATVTLKIFYIRIKLIANKFMKTLKHIKNSNLGTQHTKDKDKRNKRNRPQKQHNNDIH